VTGDSRHAIVPTEEHPRKKDKILDYFFLPFFFPPPFIVVQRKGVLFRGSSVYVLVITIRLDVLNQTTVIEFCEARRSAIIGNDHRD